MNPLAMMSTGGVNQSAVQSVKQMMQAFQMMQNPQQAIAQLMQQNPQLNTVMQMCNGKDPKAVFYAECEKRGVNPDDIIKQLR
jgi:enoyl reductase-like protein